MNWFSNLKIGKKLVVGFGVLEILLITLGVFSLTQLSKVNAGTVDIATSWLPSVRVLGELQFSVSALRRWELNHLIATDKESLAKAEEKTKSTIAAMGEAEKRYEPLISSDEEHRLYDQFRSELDKYLAIRERVLDLSRQDKKKDAETLSMSEGLSVYNGVAKLIDQDVTLNEKGATDAAKQAGAVYSSSRYWVIGILISAVALGFVAALKLASSITKGIGGMVAMIEQLAANNLVIGDMEITTEDEIGKAGVALNRMKNNLHQTIQSISETAQHVASASEELSATSQQISANSEETSAQAGTVSTATQQVSQNLQSVSTGAEEMTATIQSIASNAHEAATVASNAVQTAQAANTTVGKLGESSAEIGEVIKVITSIAQQTNLLALNATIEAARAGEAGKGFAVVANEVKELAKQTAKATEDISRKITAIQTDTKGAVDAIGSISAVINKVNDISSTIATAVEEQSATTNEMTRNVADAAKGSGEITQNIAGVAEAAQGTSSSAQESQKAASQLAEMAEQLNRLVGQFRIDAKASGVSATPVARERAKTRAASAGK